MRVLLKSGDSRARKIVRYRIIHKYSSKESVLPNIHTAAMEKSLQRFKRRLGR